MYQDRYWRNVVLLALNESGPDAGTVFNDKSRKNTIAVLNQAQWDTAQAPTGLGSSLLLDGTGDQITIAANQHTGMKLQNFTAECWIRLNVIDQTGVLFDNRTASGVAHPQLQPYVNTAEVIILWMDDGNRITGTKVLTTGVWYHVAWTRKGNTFSQWVNGALDGTPYVSASDMGSNQLVSVGANFAGSFGFNGWIAGVRITRGVVRYHSAFRPPLLPYPITGLGQPLPRRIWVNAPAVAAAGIPSLVMAPMRMAA
jgi:hypothetical protein